MESLFVYGTLRPGHENAHIMENIGGEWLPGYVRGTFYERGWGLPPTSPASCWIKMARRFTATCFSLKI